MEIHATTPSDWKKADTAAALVIPLREDSALNSPLLSDAGRALVGAVRDRKVFCGKPGDSYALPIADDGARAIILIGLGPDADPDKEKIRRAAGKAIDCLRSHRITRLVIDCESHRWPVQSFIDGIVLGQYRYDRYKKPKPDAFAEEIDDVVLVGASAFALVDEVSACNHAARVCANANWARDLGNAASNDMTPAQLAFEAQTIAEKYKLEYDCLDAGRMAELGMNALLGVARGSKEPPKLIIISHHASHDAPTLAMVGKGITFDTGGISIKPSDSMHEMKYDMCGAAAVLGAMKTVGQTKPTINVLCVVPAAENCVDGNAQKPGDIVRAYNGKTIEVHNTDAEGRMVLCDALAYLVDHYAPNKIVDVATLTGGVIVALGHYAAGVMATDDALYAEIEAASKVTGERVWRFPLWEDYSAMMEGEHADLCNIGPSRQASAIQGGCFLKEFVGDTPWAHLDIAGTAWGAKGISYLDTKFASGYGVRLLSEWIRAEADSRA
ncbi:MAG: leucyl aminopeptidase [Candidatus Hydrogenedentes bacterium]|nr:leucyl aminopeptidase [Candidatus Hydrogenedentota bacterium]